MGGWVGIVCGAGVQAQGFMLGRKVQHVLALTKDPLLVDPCKQD
jgi:hypothetical protein